MQFHGGLGLAKRRPRKQRQTKVDGGRVQRVDRVVQFHTERFVDVQASAMRITLGRTRSRYANRVSRWRPQACSA